jgi:GDP-4-dehydro-6-deoxy-D-mannose reductase
MSERILVSGAQGFVGRYLIHELLGTTDVTFVLGIGRSSMSPTTFTHLVHWADERVPAPLPPSLLASVRDRRYEYRAVDICDRPSLTKVLREFQPTVVIHLAGALRDDPLDRLIRHNIEGVACLLEAVTDAVATRPLVVLGSTGSAYGDVRSLPILEDAPCMPTDVYAVTKRAAEELARVIGMRSGLPVLVARIFNPLGPGQDERHVCGSLCSRLAAIRAGLMPPILEIGTLDTTRDFIDIVDVGRALAILIKRGEPGLVYNVASGRETSIRTILNAAIRLSGLQHLELRRVSARPWDIPRVVADISRLHALGFVVSRSIEESLQDVLHYYEETVRAARTGLEPPCAGAYDERRRRQSQC